MKEYQYMSKGGNGGKAGFEIAPMEIYQIMRIRAWGYWGSAFFDKFRRALTHTLQECWQNNRPWQALVDLQDWYPQSQDIEELMSRALREVERAGGGRKIGYIGNQAYTHSKLASWFKLSHLQGACFFYTASEAMAWALQELSKDQNRKEE